MKEDKTKEYSSLSNLLAEEKADILRKCNLCGDCLEVCPVYPLTSFSNQSPADIQQKILGALDGRPSEIAREMANSCLRCAICIKSCPMGLNPFHLQDILKAELVSCGYEVPSINSRLSDPVNALQEIMGYLQIKPSQIRWLTEVPAEPEHKDTLVFFGCGNRMMPELNLAILDLLEGMGIDFIAIGGGKLCCGYARFLAIGDLATADRMAGEWFAALNAFQPKRVAFTCGSCYHQAERLFHSVPDMSFQPMHVSKLLAEGMHRLKFNKRVEAEITVHDSCQISRKIGDVESVRKLLGAIPGVTLVEMAHNKENALCCGLGAQSSYPNIAETFRQQILDEARQTNSQVLATTCVGCHSVFCCYQKEYPFKAKHFINILAEAYGLSCEDKLTKYLQLGTADAIIDEAREFIEASPYNIEQYRQFLPLLLRFLSNTNTTHEKKEGEPL